MKKTSYPNKIINQFEADIKNHLIQSCYCINVYEGEKLISFSQSSEYIYFPLSGVTAIATSCGNQKSLVINLIGNEGLIGLGPVLGVRNEPCDWISLTSGSALKVLAKDFYSLKQNKPSVSKVIDTYIFAINKYLFDAVICQYSHSVLQRLSYFLLRYDDLTTEDEIYVTQDLFGSLIGVRRSSISNAASILKRISAISYTRGKLRILNRNILIQNVCSCYKKLN